ncbi:hypothetical protein [Pseudonocardia sp. ICBG1293]|uniref:hypothetical protein n=1 Tax=Pseudonocardia sp. ICBG1293 TaxID=2844382 RepID=UPI001CCF0B4E|nr:hypothetical protein [Pseudonocardia sp. ICBG1293]
MTDTAPGPRDHLHRGLLPVFTAGLVTFLLLGVAVVGVQAVGILIADGPLVEGVVGVLGLPMTVVATGTGLLGFAMSYLAPSSAPVED